MSRKIKHCLTIWKRIQKSRKRRRPAPTTGEKLDRIADAHGIIRRFRETDEELQERIRQRVIRKLEGVAK